MLIGALGTEPKSLDDMLSGPNVKEWQTALNYEIGQLQKLGTWVIEDLPKGHMAIPCSMVLKEKCGPDGEITSYQVHIVTSGDEPPHQICSCTLLFACIYFLLHRRAPANCLYKFPPEFRISTYASHHTTFTLHHIALQLHCLLPSTTPGDDPIPPDHTLRAP